MRYSVIAEALDVVGRVAVGIDAADAVHELGETVKADRGTVEGSKVELSHEHILHD